MGGVGVGEMVDYLLSSLRHCALSLILWLDGNGYGCGPWCDWVDVFWAVPATWIAGVIKSSTSASCRDLQLHSRNVVLDIIIPWLIVKVHVTVNEFLIFDVTFLTIGVAASEFVMRDGDEKCESMMLLVIHHNGRHSNIYDTRMRSELSFWYRRWCCSGVPVALLVCLLDAGKRIQSPISFVYMFNFFYFECQPPLLLTRIPIYLKNCHTLHPQRMPDLRHLNAGCSTTAVRLNSSLLHQLHSNRAKRINSKCLIAGCVTRVCWNRIV